MRSKNATLMSAQADWLSGAFTFQEQPGQREEAMKGHFKILIGAAATAILAGPFGNRLALAQSERSAPLQAVQSVQAPYALQYEGRVTVRADRTATDVFTHRLKILAPSASH
jgi:hypothetical protein